MSRLNQLADEFCLAVERERTAYQKVEPISRECREARQELYLEAVRVLLEDIDQIAEVATVLSYDTAAASLDVLADQLGHAVGWWIREQWRERAPRAE